MTAVRLSRLNQLTRRSRSMAACVADRLGEVALAGARRSDQHQVLGATLPVEAAQRPLGLGRDGRGGRVPGVAKAAGTGGRSQRLLNRPRTDQGRELGGAGLLGPDAFGAGRGSQDQPALGAGPELEETLAPRGFAVAGAG